MYFSIPLVCLGLAAAQFTNDNRCGMENNGLQCNPQGPYGGCCSRYGYCGSSPDHCLVDNGCQSGCDNSTKPTSYLAQAQRLATEPAPVVAPEPVPFQAKTQAPAPEPTLAVAQTQTPAHKPALAPAPVEPGNTCGDGFCDGRSETCDSCPKDCGACQLQYLDKCINPGQVALSFDDGPDQFAPQLLAFANKLDVKLTLFVIGNKLQNATYQKYLKKYHAAGHIIASHTYTHPFITKLTDDQIREEMVKTDDAIFKLIGKRPLFMRNPYADSNQRTMALLDSMGYKSIFTSLDTEDTVYGITEPYRIITNTIQGLKADPRTTPYVITQHETYRTSVNALPRIVSEIHKRRYKIVSLDTCFGTRSAYRKDICGDGKCTGYVENCTTCPSDCGRCTGASNTTTPYQK